MADTKTAEALFKAAKGGNAAKVRQLLAAGAPIEASDRERMTPVMLAAQAGQVEAFRALVEHGANLHALGMDQVDLLECAAEGGNVEIIRFLIEKGLPLEGHWQPRIPSLKRMGHITPLQMAALNGHVDAVRVLLEAGADRNATFDGQTALERAEEDIEHPVGDDEEELKPRLEQIVALLNGSTKKGKASADSDFTREVQQFAQNARRPACVRLRQKLEKRCGPLRPWKPQKDHGLAAAEVIGFKLAECQKQEELEKLQDEAAKAGCLLVLSEPWAPGEDASLVLFPTDNKYAVIAAVGTSGANDGVRTADVIHVLTSVEKENPFALVFCGHHLAGGAFQRAVKGAGKLAAKLVELCPKCQDEDCSTPEELAIALKKRKSFLLRWD